MQQFNQLIQAQFDKMCKTGKLFRSVLGGHEVWQIYIKSFNGDPIFRDPESSVHNCNLCNNFIRRYGNVVAIDENYNIMTIFDVLPDEEYAPAAEALSKALKAAPIRDVFFETFNELNSLPYESITKSTQRFKLGIDKNVKRYTKEEAEKFGVVQPDEIRTFHHMHMYLPAVFVDQSGKSIDLLIAGYRDAKNVFQRAMEGIPLDTLHLVKDLIIQGSLLDGNTYLYKIEQIIPMKQQYDSLSADKRDNWCWVTSYGLPYAKFRNEVIGTLCVELAEGEELNKACQSWNKKVDPANYMKATAPITKKQIEEAKAFIEEFGYEESFNRRFATIDDIKASEILHMNVVTDKAPTVSIFDSVKPAISTRHKRSEFDTVEEVTIEKFMKDILPGCTSVEVFLTSSQEGNMVSLTTANIKDSKPIFKWSNNYSWTFNGNLAGKSQIKQAVKDAGGNVEGVVNFRLAWNDAISGDNSDLDAWASEPGGHRIGFSEGYRRDRGQMRSPSSGQLDVDNTGPGSAMGVENITWINKHQMKDGVYKLWVNQYSPRNSQGFKAEIDVEGETYTYEYNQRVSGNVNVAEITLKDGVFSIRHILPKTTLSKEVYGLQTNNFHKVNLICTSPNHWDENNVGNKHYFFMIDGCKCPVSIRSFHAENLIPELAQHRKVLEVLGNTTMIAPSDKQLSGLGFNATVRDELVVRLQGSHKRVVKIKF